MLLLATRTVYLGTRRLRSHQLREMFQEEVQQVNESEHVRLAMHNRPIFLEVQQQVLCNIWDRDTLTLFYELSHVRETILNQRI